MLYQLIFENIHFALGLLAALTFLAAFWLHHDAWRTRPTWKDLWKWLGFLLLALSFFIYATTLEQSSFGQSLFGWAAEEISLFVRIIGFGLLAIGHFLDPLQPVPEPSVYTSKKTTQPMGLAAGVVGWSVFLKLASAAGSLVTAWFYWRRSTKGLERHLKGLAFGFAALSGFELLSLTNVWRESSNVTLAKLAAAFGPVWRVQHLLLAFAVIIISRWVWAYLITRIQNQLMIVFTSAIVVIFLITTASFTYLLLKNIRTESLANLETAVKVLDYSLQSKKAETASLAETMSENLDIRDAIKSANSPRLGELTASYLKDKQQSTLVFTNADGQVLLRAEDIDRKGESISDDPLIVRSLFGSPASGVSQVEGVVAPTVTIRSSSPVRAEDHTIIGTVTVGINITNEFVDSIKKATGLETTVYGGNSRSATTFVTADGKSRLIGVKEGSKPVTDAVLGRGELFVGRELVGNSSYLTVFAPLKDADNVPVGMLFVGQPELLILLAAGRSIELTFIVVMLLLLLSPIPIYFVSKQIARQVSG